MKGWDKRLFKDLEFQLDAEGAIQTVLVGRHDGDIHAYALVFIADGGDQGREPAAIAHLWIAAEAANDGADAQRAHLDGLVVHAQVVRVGAVAIVETAGRDRGNRGKAVFGAQARIAVVQVLVALKVIRIKARVEPGFAQRLIVYPA